ncbi:MAG: TonB-dependent receptor [Pseudomonadota bacterium]
MEGVNRRRTTAVKEHVAFSSALMLCAITGFIPSDVLAQPQAASDRIYEEVLVTGGAQEIRSLTGSATLLDESQILTYDSIDVNNLLRQVPGVYLRIEDGYGLRPNIGLRGATSERSQKITLMEDGVLIAPAPYSAPAAYYMPNINRMSSVEVFKGPSAIKYGPHTVGGAINMVTPAIPESSQGKAEAAYGTDNYQKYRVFYGDTIGQWGYWVDALRFSSDGFKDLDTGGDTGFHRNDINTKIQWSSANASDVQQTVQLKLGYADENSDETYLGLTDADFDLDPNRRYVSSELDNFKSKHYQVHLFHLMQFDEAWQLNTRAYSNYFERDWFKFDGFIGSTAPAAAVVLANPETYPREIELLRGEVNSNGTERETLDVTDFIRDYGSSGIETGLKHARRMGEVEHNIELGVRYHYDFVRRKQDQQGYLMENESLVSDEVDRPLTLSNSWKTNAIAVYAADRLDYKNWSFDLGLRYEYIDGEAEDRLNGTVTSRDQDVWLPGVGVLYRIGESWALLAGVNKGFSPVSPGAASTVDPEESINYEYGARYSSTDLYVELIGFFSDYQNLLGRCGVSDPTCEVGEEFNGGDVEIAGWEFSSNYTATLANGLTMPLSLVYTYTETAFQDTFISNFPLWNPGFFQGVQLPVLQGDELPYTPDHQARVQIGLQGIQWSTNLAVRYISEMREVPGSGGYPEGESTDDYTIVDLAATYELSEQLAFRFIVENIADEEVIVSRRPFGARPNLPRQFKLGVSYLW